MSQKNAIIEMAVQAGYDEHHAKFDFRLEAFAKLVAAKRDPKIAIADAYRAGVDSGIAAEREACAKVCGRLADEALVVGDEDAVMCFEEAEDAIRARSCN